ncbi:MAG: TRAP transporter small permease subunit [Rhodobacteraceae bacterium]|uniref:TRAP transporter small permease n=1 Tax=Salipiger sp. HF18 TaxID=2721557 RepID=UPI00142E1DBC|nr:TRAP transporter small permease [Salipiger sp. HF18]NIY94866.1 TRAP transporter small permease subunit [Salipiger sp. HF18]NVK61968.1 TRAP transporter small permease subunit [Paracoccaceae bacterium]
MTTEPRTPGPSGPWRALDLVVGLGAWAGALCVVGILASYSIEVFMRYLLNAPTAWASDFVKYFLCGAVFLAMPLLTRDGAHVSVTVFKGRLPAGIEAMAVRLGLLISAVVCLMVGWLALQQTLYNYERGIDTMSLIAIPKWIVAAPIAYGFLMSGLVLLAQLVRADHRVAEVAQ